MQPGSHPSMVMMEGGPTISTEGRAILEKSGSLPHFFGGPSRPGSMAGHGANRVHSMAGHSTSGLPSGLPGLRLAVPDDDAPDDTVASVNTMQATRQESSIHDASRMRVSIGGTVYLGGELIVSATGVHLNGLPASDMKPHDFIEDGKFLGRGVSGSVRRMLHRGTRERIAVKEIPLGRSEIAMQNVRRELKTLFTAKQHGAGLVPAQAVKRGAAYLVDFYGAWASEGSVSIAMECMDGSVGDFLGNRCPEHVAARITAMMLRGLRFLHEEAFLVHRDLKPPNLLFRRNGVIKITDFGLASQLASDQGRTNSFVGSVLYMSPERLRGEAYSLSSDVWAVGLTVAEIVLGYHPLADAEQATGGHQEIFWKLLHMYENNCGPAHAKLRDAAAAHKLSAEFVDFVTLCTLADADTRPSCSELLRHPWIVKAFGASASSDLVGAQPAGTTLDEDDDDDGIGGFSSDDDDEDPAVAKPAAASAAASDVSLAEMAADPVVAEWLRSTNLAVSVSFMQRPPPATEPTAAAAAPTLGAVPDQQ